MSTRKYDSEAIRSELLAYLREPVFGHFTPSDVADYGALGQIWVKTYPAAGCQRDFIFDHRQPVLTFNDRCTHTHTHTEAPSAAYTSEVTAMSTAFATMSSTHSVVLPTRNRPIPPNQPPHPVAPPVVAPP